MTERERTATLREEDIERFRRGDILLSDEQATIFCDLALKGLRAESKPERVDTAELVMRLQEPRLGIHEDGTEELKTWEQLYAQCLEAALVLAFVPSATAFTRDAIIEHCAVLAECANPHDGRDHTECPFCCSAADIRTLKNAAPQDDLKGSEALHRPLAGLAASSHRPDATPAVAAPDRNPWPEVIAEPQNTSGPQGDMAGIIEAAERYRWFRDECAWFRRADIVEVAGEDADMLDHHIDKGRCGL